MESVKRDAVIHAVPTRKQPSRVQEVPRESPSELDLPLDSVGPGGIRDSAFLRSPHVMLLFIDHFERQALGCLRLLLGVRLSPFLFCVHGAPEPGSSVQGGRSFVLATSQDSNQDHGPVCSPQRCHMANLATLQPCPCCQPPLPSISRPILRLGIGSCCDALGLEPSL